MQLVLHLKSALAVYGPWQFLIACIFFPYWLKNNMWCMHVKHVGEIDPMLSVNSWTMGRLVVAEDLELQQKTI